MFATIMSLFVDTYFYPLKISFCRNVFFIALLEPLEIKFCKLDLFLLPTFVPVVKRIMVLCLQTCSSECTKKNRIQVDKAEVWQLSMYKYTKKLSRKSLNAECSTGD